MKILITNLCLSLLTLPCLFAQKNTVKINLSSMALSDLYLSYERVIAKKFSFQIGLNWTPEKRIPFSKNFSAIRENESPMVKMTMTGWSITPELKLYTSFDKKAPEGFYISPYFRYSQYSFQNKDYHYKYSDHDNKDITKSCQVDFTGNAVFYGGGIMIGHQWIIKEHFSIDFWILGLGVSNAKFELKATSNTLDPSHFAKGSDFSEDMADNMKALNSVEISNGSNFVQATSSRTLPGLRGLGLNVGWAF